ncbi:unnamed protein product [Linum trigynum]|uniref:Reverse transcriptase Ty1/copia-type domain-containing protein n=1 Tax=Linum trigynum TaxID=586398 RepID=A0AAV2DAX6_9ROSI
MNITTFPEPQTYAQASSDPRWNKAIKEEWDALEDNKTWEIVDLPAGKTTIGSKWVYKTKFRSDGDIERLKARVVAKGYTQVHGVDFWDTFSLVAKQNSVKLLIKLAAAKHWHLHQMDVSNAFLNGFLDEEIYMELPPRLNQLPEYKGKVCKLQKSLYGMKQASRQWFVRLTDVLLKLGFKQSYSDYSVFSYSSGKDHLFLVIYVDDMILASSNMDLIQQVKQWLHKEFKVKDLEEFKYFLGPEIQRSEKGISLNQRKLCLEMLANASYLNNKPAKTPLSMKTVLSAEDGVPLDDGDEYRHLLGQLQYLTTTRPDIAFPVQQLSQFQSNPASTHLHALHRVLRYLKGSLGQGLWFSSTSDLTIRGYSDTDWATCPDTRRSVTGYCTFLGISLITWKSKKQTIVSRSSSEAEYRALPQLCCEVQWMKGLMEFFHVSHPQPIPLYWDNQSAIYTAKNPVFHE